MPMSSTTVLSSVYSDRDFAPAGANWLTYACIPIADLAALLLTALLSEGLCYLFFGRFAFTNYLRFAPCVVIFYAVFALAGLYPGLPVNPIDEFRLSLRAVGLSFLIITGGTFLMGNSPLLCLILVTFAWLLASVLVPLGRHVARLWCSQQPWWGIPTVILGERAAGMRILSVLQANRQFGLRPIAILFDPPASDGSTATPSNVFCGELSHSAIFSRNRRKCYAILATPLTSSERVRAIFAEHADHYRRVLVIPDLVGFTSLAVRAKDIHGILGLEIDHNLTRTCPHIFKRSFDISICVFTALLIWPIFLVVGLAVKLTSPGPMFYSQRRIGRNGNEFRLWKFRTMIVDADAVLEKYLENDESLRAEWRRDRKLRNDPRVTTIGAFLRRTSLDELPQFWNILCGEMSLVGPRPIRQPEVEKYGTIFNQYRRVTPGLTGLWQISGRNNTSYERRTQLDEYYVRNWSISLDLYILLRTLKTIILTEGAY
jgi:Undecaprenyl-phosphate galactose phosphotransferase WbaP